MKNVCSYVDSQMRHPIYCGQRFIEVEMPGQTKIISGGWHPDMPAIKDVEAAMTNALDSPVDTKPLSELAKGARKVVIAFDDLAIARTGNSDVRPLAIAKILEELRKAGVSKGDISLTCAIGLHRKWTRRELSWLLGEELVKEFGARLTCHDPEDKDNIVHLGETNGGYDVEINKSVLDSDLTVYVNAGYFRGLFGGWKSLFVGLSTYQSIRWFHGPDISGSLRRNPTHEVLNEMGDFFTEKTGKTVFKIETLACDAGVANIFAGSVSATRSKALDALSSQTPQKSPERSDVVVIGLPNYCPYTIFSYMNPLLTLISMGLGYVGGLVEWLGRKGCSVILCTPCRDAWDDLHFPAYKEIWDKVLGHSLNPYEIQDLFEEAYAHRPDFIYKFRHCYGFHPVHGIFATYMLRRLGHVGKVYVACAENQQLVRHIGFEPAQTLDEALRKAEDIHGKDYSVTLYSWKPPKFAVDNPELFDAKI